MRVCALLLSVACPLGETLFVGPSAGDMDRLAGEGAGGGRAGPAGDDEPETAMVVVGGVFRPGFVVEMAGPVVADATEVAVTGVELGLLLLRAFAAAAAVTADDDDSEGGMIS